MQVPKCNRTRQDGDLLANPAHDAVVHPSHHRRRIGVRPDRWIM
jgi:hypothetical protein